VSLWSQPHLWFLRIAYGFSWLLWVGAWALSVASDTGTVLFHADLVWEAVFEGRVGSSLLPVSLTALVAVYGPMLGGIVASRRDDAFAGGDL
jgi:hypothetical protein